MAQKSLKMTQIICDQQRKSIIIVCAKDVKNHQTSNFGNVQTNWKLRIFTIIDPGQMTKQLHTVKSGIKRYY